MSSPSPSSVRDCPEVFRALVDTRRSCRGFLPTPVPDETVRDILATAQRAASWCNIQPWHVHVTRGRATEKLRQALLADVHSRPTAHEPDVDMPSHYLGVHRARRRECGWQLYDAMGVLKGDREASSRAGLRNFDFFGAPHVAVITSDRTLGAYGILDTGLWLATFMLAAESRGIATVAQAAIATRAPVIRRALGIGEGQDVLFGVSFGVADVEHPANNFRTTRADLADSVQFHE